MNAHQQKIIEDNLKAFEDNFGPVEIKKEDYGYGFYVYYPYGSPSYIQYCYNIDYLNGWLYGVVQGVRRGEFKEVRNGN